jgi:hypothetical protein
MPDWTISTTGMDAAPARRLAEQTYSPLTRTSRTPRTYLLAGSHQPHLAACASAAIDAGHRIVLLPNTPTRPLPAGALLNISGQHPQPSPTDGVDVRGGWDVAMFSSGSTTGTPRGYGFTRQQLDQVTAWYEQIYQASPDSIIVTALPSAYNFTFVAGVLLAARLGARLHLSRSFRWVLDDAAHLAPRADRLIVLANPVVLDQATPSRTLPTNVLVDSGGAPLNTTTISDYRDHGIDVREGYGLTETASLTHFDAEASPASLGTVGVGMPGVHTRIDTSAGKPIVELASPATGIPLDPAEPPPGDWSRTTDLGSIDEQGRLRLLGRSDDEQINGLWPHDTLDNLGPLLGRRCALIRQRSDAITVKLLTPPEGAVNAIRRRAADLLNLPETHVAVTWQGAQPLLHSAKLARI